MVRAAWPADFVSVPGYDGVALCTAADRHIAPAQRAFRGLRIALRTQSRIDTPASEFEADLTPIAIDDERDHDLGCHDDPKRCVHLRCLLLSPASQSSPAPAPQGGSR